MKKTHFLFQLVHISVIHHHHALYNAIYNLQNMETSVVTVLFFFLLHIFIYVDLATLKDTLHADQRGDKPRIV